MCWILALKKALLTVDADLCNGETCLCLKGSDTVMGNTEPQKSWKMSQRIDTVCENKVFQDRVLGGGFLLGVGARGEAAEPSQLAELRSEKRGLVPGGTCPSFLRWEDLF